LSSSEIATPRSTPPFAIERYVDADVAADFLQITRRTLLIKV
jgi:hypothetical protein